MCESGYNILCIRQHYKGGETVTRRKRPLAKREDKYEKRRKDSRKMTTESLRNNNLKNCLIFSSIARTLVSHTQKNLPFTRKLL